MDVTSNLHDLVILPLGRKPGTHFVGWVSPRAGLGTSEKSKISLSLPGIEPLFTGFPAYSQSLYQQSNTMAIKRCSY